MCQNLFFNKVAQVFSCEFCEILTNTHFTKHLRATDSESCMINKGNVFGVIFIIIVIIIIIIIITLFLVDENKNKFTMIKLC